MQNFFDISHYRTILEKTLALTKQFGATSAAVGIGGAVGFNVDVRLKEVEKIEYHKTCSLGITAYLGHKKAGIATNDLSLKSIMQIAEKVCQMAKYGNEDPCAGLPESSLLAYDCPDLDLDYPWNIDVNQALNLAMECESIALNLNKNITNSEGASVSTGRSFHILGNSLGFLGNYITTNHSLSCSLVAGCGDEMQRDGDYSTARNALDLWSAEKIAKNAVENTIKRLGARTISTTKCPVIFESQVAKSLIGGFLSAISGHHLYRNASFLLNKIGEKIFPENVSILDDPFQKTAWGSSPFDAEGVKPQKRYLVQDGVLQGYLLDSYTARKLKMQTTGNAGGSHNVYINDPMKYVNKNSFKIKELKKENAGKDGNQGLADLLQKMGKGFLVTELLGSGANIVTGDYSRAAFGFWVENGIIQYPVIGVTIASTLQEMFKRIIAVGNDVDSRSSIYTGSILIEEMTVAG